jgi:hypothetical protein
MSYQLLSNIPNIAYDLNLPKETLGCKEVCGVDISGFYYSHVPKLFDSKGNLIEQLQYSSDPRRLVMSITCCKPPSPFYVLLSSSEYYSKLTEPDLMYPTVRLRVGDKVINTNVENSNLAQYRTSNLIGQMRKPYEAMQGRLYKISY